MINYPLNPNSITGVLTDGPLVVVPRTNSTSCTLTLIGTVDRWKTLNVHVSNLTSDLWDIPSLVRIKETYLPCVLAKGAHESRTHIQ